MRRRKLLIGMASLAAGGAATMGTGALSSVEADRSIRGKIVGDERAYIEINGFDTSENSFALERDGSEVLLDFDQDPDYNKYNSSTKTGNEEAEGLNADAVSTFDAVFRIQNDGTEEMAVWITDNLDDVTWYGTRPDGGDVDPSASNSLEGESNAVTLQPFDEEASPSAGSDPPNTEIDVGVKFDLRGRTSTGDIFTGDDNFTIHADETPT